VRIFVYFPSSKDEAVTQHYCGEDVFSLHPECGSSYRTDQISWVRAAAISMTSHSLLCLVDRGGNECFIFPALRWGFRRQCHRE
jgi:hypothetical protein